MESSAQRATPVRKTGFFYGWVVVTVMVAFSAITVAMAGPNFGQFIKPMQAELGWGATIFGISQTVRMFAGVVTGPAIGRMIDRFGPRVPVATAALLLGLSLIAMKWMSTQWQMLVPFAITGLIGMGRAADMYVGATIAKWFIRKRGLAMSIAMAGTPIGIIFVFPLTQYLIDHFGWRQTLFIFGASGAALIVPMSLIWLRREPEDMGLLPDGDTSRPSVGSAGDETSWTRAEAMRHPTFWLMLLGFSLFSFAFSTVTVFRVPHYIERGLNPSTVAFAVTADSIVAVISSVVLGTVFARAASRVVVAAGMAGMAACTALLIVVGDNWVLFISSMLWGFGIQVAIVAQSVMWGDYWGRRHLGAIRGITIPLTIGVGSTAFFIAGLIRDEAGSYTPAWFMAIAVFAASVAVLLPLRKPRRRLAPGRP
ncbi:MAG: MFS transporter [SAR202 cluster bacterium]|nr:MFS transporter [SAR202 cluster bacterium]